MPFETMKSGQPTTTAEGEKEKQSLFNKDIKDMVSAITHRFHKPGSSQHGEDDDDHGASVITLAGTNIGATMRSELDEKSGSGHPHRMSHGKPEDGLSTFVNSNFQAVNNSIMFSSKYKTHDPGVHLDISDSIEPQEGPKHDVQKRKGKKKKEKESLKSDHHSEEDSD